MSRKLPIFYSALLLTGVNLLLRFAGTSFQVFLSARIGPEGIGLLQLVLSVGSLATVAGMAGIRTGAMYLTAEAFGHGHPGSIRYVLSGCLLYSILCSGAVAAGIWLAAPWLATNWICNPAVAPAVRLFALFLPANCLTGVMVGYFTGANRIGTLAAVEVAEQALSILCTLSLLHFWAGSDPALCCQAVILGGGLSNSMALLCLTVLHLTERTPAGPRLPVMRRLMDVAMPLALADDLKTGINTAENLMVPKRLALYAGALSPLAAFGTVSGMVFPILMFPACILYGLAELLIPELARCAAAGSRMRIRYLVRRSLRMAAFYGIYCSGLIFLSAEGLCLRFYKSTEAGFQLRLYAPLIPMLYCDAIVDAMTKGLGQQKTCVKYNIFTSALDLFFLYILLPKYGMTGYFLSFFVTHLINFLLSLRRLLKITGIHLSTGSILLLILSAVAAVWISHHATLAPLLYPVVLSCLLTFTGVLKRSDLRWLRNLITARGA